MGSLNRRALFGAVPAVALAATVPVADDAAQFVAWDRECKQAWAKANAPSTTEARTRKWCLRAHEIEQDIISTRARSHEAMLIKLATLERIATENLDTDYAEVFSQAAAFIKGAN
jgi:hypothetical protein